MHLKILGESVFLDTSGKPFPYYHIFLLCTELTASKNRLPWNYMNIVFKTIGWIVGAAVVVGIGYALLSNIPTAPAPEKNSESASMASSTPVSVEPIKIGMIAPLTGDGATYGEPMRNIIAIAIDEINKSGGVNGRELIPVYEDDKCTGEGGANAIQKLITIDRVKVVIGSMCSSATLAAVPIAEAAQVALFSPGASSPDLTNKSRFFARNYPSDSSQGKILADAAYTMKKWKKIAIIQEQKDYPLGIFKIFDARFKELGGTIIKEEFAPSATDFRSSLTKLKAKKPDALFIIVQTAPAADRILKQINNLKWKIALMVNDVIPGDPTLLKNQKTALEGALTAEFSVSNNAKLQRLIAHYKTKYGVDMPYQAYGQTEYDSVYIVREALMAVGEDGAKIADWLKTVKDWDGASGKVTIGADGDRVGGHILEIIKEGKSQPAQ